MARFRFAITETNVGFIDVYADNENEAREFLECNVCEPYICGSETEIGELIETDND